MRRNCEIELVSITVAKGMGTVEKFKSDREFLYYTYDGIISMEDNKISLSFDNEDGENFKYLGEENGSGHYLLKSTDSDEKCTLHGFPSSKILDGYWLDKENDDEGFWRVRIK